MRHFYAVAAKSLNKDCALGFRLGPRHICPVSLSRSGRIPLFGPGQFLTQSTMNITDPIFFQSWYQPEAPAICAPGIDLVTYGRLEKTINNIMRRALSLDVQPGQVVALVVKQPVIHAAIILAMARLGVVTASPSAATLPTGLMFD